MLHQEKQSVSLSGTDLLKIKEKIGKADIEKYIGIKERVESCIGQENGCVRPNFHLTHNYISTSLLTDPVISSGKNTDSIYLPIRYWNYLIGLSITKDIFKAIDWVKANSFINDKPKDMTNYLECKNYSHILKEYNIMP